MLSFIVPAHNEETLLPKSLSAIRAACDPLACAYEIIVVNDASTDATSQIASAHGARVETVALRKIAAVRNAGARAARGDRFLFVDADTFVTPEVVRAAAAAMDRGAVGGGATVEFEGRIPLWARVMLLAFVPFYHGMGWAAGCFIFCTRAAFEAVGGFDESVYAAEEVLMSRALRRLGRFRVLRERVITSSRKLRTHTMSEVLGPLFRLGWRGQAALREGHRPEFSIWYGPRREDRG